MKNLQKGIKKKVQIFLFSLFLLMNSFSSVTWANTTNDYHVVLAETAAQIQQLDSNPGLNSSWNIIGLVRCNATVPKGYYNTFYQNVQKGLSDCGGQLTTTRYTEYSKLILSVTAIGKDAQNVGGYNLLSYLSNYDHVSKQGINGTIWALIAVNAKSTYDFPKEKGVAVQTTKKLLVDKLLAVELKTGGFTLYGSEADVDMTAMAVSALAPYYNSRADVKSAIDRALLILSSKQNNTGEYQSGGISNAESTAQVLTALSAISIDAATDSRYVKESKSVLMGLLSYYLGKGSFSHTSGGASNALATEQSFQALVAYDCFQKGGKLYDMEDIPNNPAIKDAEKTPEKTTETKPTNTTPTTPTLPTTPTPPTTPVSPVTTPPETNTETNTEANIEANIVSSSSTDTDETLATSVVATASTSDGKSENKDISMVIAKDSFVGLQGKDSNYKMDGKTADGTAYSWTFHGTDIKTPMDFDGTLVLGGDYAGQINELSDAPFIFAVGQQAFPGEALLTLTTGLADGSYGLFSYDATTQTARLLQKVEVKSGQTRCILEEGGNYFIAVKSKAALVKEQEAVTETQTVMTAVVSDGSTETMVSNDTSDNDGKSIVVKTILFTIILAILTGIVALRVNRIPESTEKEAKKKEEEQDETKML